jgi:hypothetical protein
MDSEGTVQFDTLLPHRLGSAPRSLLIIRGLWTGMATKGPEISFWRVGSSVALVNDRGRITGKPEVNCCNQAITLKTPPNGGQ